MYTAFSFTKNVFFSFLQFIWMSNLGAAVSDMRKMKMNAKKRAEEKRKEKKDS